MRKLKSVFARFNRKAMAVSLAVTSVMMLSVPAFAVEGAPIIDTTTGIVDATAFDPLVTSVTGNIGAVFPKVVIILGLVVGLSVVIGFVRKNAKA